MGMLILWAGFLLVVRFNTLRIDEWAVLQTVSYYSDNERCNSHFSHFLEQIQKLQKRLLQQSKTSYECLYIAIARVMGTHSPGHVSKSTSRH